MSLPIRLKAVTSTHIIGKAVIPEMRTYADYRIYWQDNNRYVTNQSNSQKLLPDGSFSIDGLTPNTDYWLAAEGVDYRKDESEDRERVDVLRIARDDLSIAGSTIQIDKISGDPPIAKIFGGISSIAWDGTDVLEWMVDSEADRCSLRAVSPIRFTGKNADDFANALEVKGENPLAGDWAAIGIEWDGSSLFGWAIDSKHTSVPNTTVVSSLSNSTTVIDVADGSGLAAGHIVDISSERRTVQSVAGNTVTLSIPLSSTPSAGTAVKKVVRNTASLYTITGSVTYTLAGSIQPLDDGDWSGADITWNGSDLLGWLVDNSRNIVRLYSISRTAGTPNLQGPDQWIGKGDWRGAGLCWDGTTLFGWLVNNDDHTAHLYAVDRNTGIITKRGLPQRLDDRGWSVGGLSHNRFRMSAGGMLWGMLWNGTELELIGRIVDERSRIAALYAIDRTTGALAFRGSWYFGDLSIFDVDQVVSTAEFRQ